MAKIRSFEEAKQCVDDLREFLDFADSAISGVSALKGGKRQELPFKSASAKPAENGTSQPDGWTDGVKTILNAIDKPLRPVDILTLWEARGWERPPERRKFYIAVNGGLQYLLKRNIVEKLDDSRYKLRNKN